MREKEYISWSICNTKRAKTFSSLCSYYVFQCCKYTRQLMIAIIFSIALRPQWQYQASPSTLVYDVGTCVPKGCDLKGEHNMEVTVLPSSDLSFTRTCIGFECMYEASQLGKLLYSLMSLKLYLLLLLMTDLVGIYLKLSEPARFLLRL